ncbi:hypothetical protein MES5069_550209 [Mesorhizobium escarrei]|uniref:Uncharacterized protein n=1 Tax=Mesorhizobium escarrei TaxID=666018 RepID=A0ABN8KET0_9HYPH|nr:hypothetical protein MES5069_550209 [Mesorhizobium escarrei]
MRPSMKTRSLNRVTLWSSRSTPPWPTCSPTSCRRISMSNDNKMRRRDSLVSIPEPGTNLHGREFLLSREVRESHVQTCFGDRRRNSLFR